MITISPSLHFLQKPAEVDHDMIFKAKTPFVKNVGNACHWFFCLAPVLFISCAKVPVEDSSSTISTTPTNSSRYLYLATGSCYSGAGITAYSNLNASNKIFRVDVNTGQPAEPKIADYMDNKSQLGDTPVGLVNNDLNSIYVLVQNTTAGTKRIDRIPKGDNPARTLLTNSASIFSANLRSISKTVNGDLLVSESTGVERINGVDLTRISIGNNPYVRAPAAPCATSTSLITRAGTLSNKMIYFLHAAASQNRIGFVKASGYVAGGDCTPAQTAPNVAAYPTASAYDSVNEVLIVAYGGGNAVTADINSIYAYKLNVTSNSVTIASSNKIYDQTMFPATYSFQLYGIPSMALDATTNNLFVATTISTAATAAGYRVEKLKYDPSKIGIDNTLVLSRASNGIFLPHSSDTKCVADMMIAN